MSERLSRLLLRLLVLAVIGALAGIARDRVIKAHDAEFEELLGRGEPA